MTAAEQTAMQHVRSNASAWRWTAAEILSNAQLHASLDPYQLSRLPDLMQAEISAHRATRNSSTAN